ncbi:sensor histidine kinase [Geodermatophilus sp. CPCC 206100]|uniref:sensor histidine kinase n=1 Tax=Geodermatophilus sp. CPCC 206100 TaxID=3020054 RepID=UPI003B00A6E8
MAGTVSAPERTARWERPLLAAGRAAADVLWAAVPDPPWQLRRGRWTALLVWAAVLYGLVVALTAASVVINDRNRMVGGLAFLLVLPSVLALASAVHRPLDGWRLGTLWLLVVPYLLRPPSGLVPPLEPWQWCLWCPVLLAAAWAATPRQAAALAGLSALAVGVSTLLSPWPVHGGYLVVSLIGALVPIVVGASLGARGRARRALAEEQARAAATQAARGALAERARIAREMHDVVAHHLSLIAVRCETAPYRLAPLPEPAGGELAEVAAAARSALTELQRVLGVLRTEDQQAERAPQPGLGALPGLLAAARDAGTDVSWQLTDGEVEDTVGLSVFRIVQQALANAVQHAPGAPVRVSVLRDGGALRIEVTNGPGRGGGTPGAGLGLAGMRERAEVHGGWLDAGACPGGGFRVLAQVPADGDGGR